MSSIYQRATIAEGLIGGLAVAVAVAVLIGLRGDRRTRHGAKVAALIAAVVLLAPLVLGLVGPDYFLARNVIPAMIPLAVVIAAACTLPRARLAGSLLAAVLLAAFLAATPTSTTTTICSDRTGTISPERSDRRQRPARSAPPAAPLRTR